MTHPDDQSLAVDRDIPDQIALMQAELDRLGAAVLALTWKMERGFTVCRHCGCARPTHATDCIVREVLFK